MDNYLPETGWDITDYKCWCERNIAVQRYKNALQGLNRLNLQFNLYLILAIFN